MIRAGAMRCLRGFPNRKRAEYTLVYHSGKDFIFEVVTNSQLKPTFVIPKKDILSIDLLLLDNLEKKCNSLVNDTIPGEILFGSAHLYMDGKWYNDTIRMAPVKSILCITYKGKIEELNETIYLTARKSRCTKIYKELKEAWKAPPEYYRNNTGGDAGGSSYQYMGEY